MQKLTSVSLKEALESSSNLVQPNQPSHLVDLSNSLDKVLSEDIYCQKNLPAFNNSALDGFALKHTQKNRKLKIKATIYAGDSIDDELKDDECYKIMTGAKIPSCCDTIVPFEDVIEFDDKFVTIGDKVKKGNAFRIKGEELSSGEKLFDKGQLIDSSVIAMLASQGIPKVKVYKDITIAVFSTGNELKEPWEKASDDEIYNVNSSSLIALFKEFGFDAHYSGVIPDNLEETKEYFKDMLEYDVLVTTGGISMGEADFVEEALLHHGLKPLFHGINLKPGRPTMIGNINKTIVASMPGNPLAAYVNAFLILIPLLKKLQGNKDFEHKKTVAKISKDLKVKPNRTNLVLGEYKDGYFSVTRDNKYGSGMIMPFIESNALLVLGEDKEYIKKDEEIEIYLIK